MRQSNNKIFIYANEMTHTVYNIAPYQSNIVIVVLRHCEYPFRTATERIMMPIGRISDEAG
jgi:hypothetical protein